MKVVSLGDVCVARSSLVDPTLPENRDLPHIAPDTIERDTGRLLPYRTVAEDGVTSGKYRFETGDLLYSKIRPNLNKVVRVHLNGLCSADMYALDVDRAKAVPEFLAHVLRGPRFLDFATSVSNRANIPKLNRAQLMAFEFTLPPLPEQRRIAKILDQADELRARRRRTLALHDDLTQAIFLDMFGEGAHPIVALGELADVASGITKGRRLAASVPTRVVPYLAVSNVQDGHLNLDVVKTIDASEQEVSRYALQFGDLVMTEGGDPDKLGRGALWRSDIEPCLHQNHIFRVRVRDSDALLVEYLNSFIGGRPARAYFMRSAKQTTGIASINMTQLRALPVAVPPAELQREFVRRVEAARAVRQIAEADQLDELFAALQARAFAGQL